MAMPLSEQTDNNEEPRPQSHCCGGMTSDRAAVAANLYLLISGLVGLGAGIGLLVYTEGGNAIEHFGHIFAYLIGLTFIGICTLRVPFAALGIWGARNRLLWPVYASLILTTILMVCFVLVLSAFFPIAIFDGIFAWSPQYAYVRDMRSGVLLRTTTATSTTAVNRQVPDSNGHTVATAIAIDSTDIEEVQIATPVQTSASATILS